MAKVNVGAKKEATKQRRVSSFTCFECGQKKDAKDFYKNPSNPLGICSICTECIHRMVVDESGEFVVREKLIEVLRKLDRPFIQKEYRYYCQLYDGYPKRIVGYYFGQINRLAEYKTMKFADSIYEEEPEIERHYQDEEGNSPTREWEEDYKEDVGKNGWEQTGIRDNSEYKQALDENTSRKKKLQAKWGKFTSLEYLERCEQLYQDIVDGGYNVVSAMHEVSLKNAVRIQIEHDIAFEKGDFERMKTLAPMMKTARDEARLNPKQILDDFQSNGASTFSEMSLRVNQAKGMLYLDMGYFAQPKDDVDVMLWEYVKYCQHMLGMPEMNDYGELYAFFLKRILEIYEEDYPDDLLKIEEEMKKYNLLELAKEFQRLDSKKK